MNYDEIETKSCNEVTALFNKYFAEGMLLNIKAAKKRIRQIDKSISVIRDYVELNSWLMGEKDVLDNQKRIAKLRGEKVAYQNIIAEHEKCYKEVKE